MEIDSYASLENGRIQTNSDHSLENGVVETNGDDSPKNGTMEPNGDNSLKNGTMETNNPEDGIVEVSNNNSVQEPLRIDDETPVS